MSLLMLCTILSGCALPHPASISVAIDEPILPATRKEKYEEPLDRALKQAKLGEVVGAYSQLSDQGKIEKAKIVIFTEWADKAMPLILQTLNATGTSKFSTSIQSNNSVPPIPTKSSETSPPKR